MGKMPVSRCGTWSASVLRGHQHLDSMHADKAGCPNLQPLPNNNSTCQDITKHTKNKICCMSDFELTVQNPVQNPVQPYSCNMTAVSMHICFVAHMLYIWLDLSPFHSHCTALIIHHTRLKTVEWLVAHLYKLSKNALSLLRGS